MGKGGCFDVFEQGVQFIRAILGCICCLLCTGPILLIVGIVLLVAPNNFTANMNTYKNSIATYNSQALPILQQTQGTVDTYYNNNYNLGVTTKSIQFKGANADQATPFTSTLLVATVQSGTTTSTGGTGASYQTSNSIQTLQYGNFPSMQAKALRMPQFQPGYNPVTAFAKPSSSCSSTPSSSKSGCTQADFNTNCQNLFGQEAQFSSGSCTWFQQEKYICSPIFFSNNQWTIDTFDASFVSGGSMYPSCDYIDGSQTAMGSYSASPVKNGFGFDPLTISYSSFSSSPTIDIQLRSSLDPYIIASKVTKGTFDFGLTAAQQRGIGAALIAVGCILIACVIGSCVLVQRMMSRDPRNGAAVYGAFGRTYTPAQGYAMPPGTYGGVYYGGGQPAPYDQPVGAPYQAMPPQQPYQAQPDQQPPPQGYPPQQQQQQCSPQYPPPQQPGYGQPQPYQQPQQYQGI